MDRRLEPPPSWRPKLLSSPLGAGPFSTRCPRRSGRHGSTSASAERSGGSDLGAAMAVSPATATATAAASARCGRRNTCGSMTSATPGGPCPKATSISSVPSARQTTPDSARSGRLGTVVHMALDPTATVWNRDADSSRSMAAAVPPRAAPNAIPIAPIDPRARIACSGQTYRMYMLTMMMSPTAAPPTAQYAIRANRDPRPRESAPANAPNGSVATAQRKTVAALLRRVPGSPSDRSTQPSAPASQACHSAQQCAVYWGQAMGRGSG